ncbi:3',5'-cyclic-nucleotide phosphodiesterase [Methylobacterium sp. E-005]|uniref:3',5'-cyclic-nucleotide phosphodiesterase n=1 Tax=Methylobacterium sp. E-005 TaxID=2836549 RepID=UPI0039198FD5
MIRLLNLAMTIALLTTAPALAASKRGNEDLKRFCTGDATTFCGDVDPDSDKMDACFAEHRKELSENCRRAIDAYQAGGGK